MGKKQALIVNVQKGSYWVDEDILKLADGALAG